MNNIFTPTFSKKPAIDDNGSRRQLAFFNDLYDSYAPAFYGEIKRNLYQQDLCNQTLADAFLQIGAHMGEFDESKERLFTWCYRIVRKEIRKKKVDLMLKEIFACQLLPTSKVA